MTVSLVPSPDGRGVEFAGQIWSRRSIAAGMLRYHLGVVLHRMGLDLCPLYAALDDDGNEITFELWHPIRYVRRWPTERARQAPAACAAEVEAELKELLNHDID